MRVEWLPRAQSDLEDQLAWIAQRNPLAAVGMGDTVLAAIDRLSDHPALGRTGRVGGTRELVVAGTPYFVVYVSEASAVTVLRILHGAQRWPPP